MVLTICCQTSNVRCTKSKNFNVSRLVLQLSLPNPFKPGVKLKNEDVVEAAMAGAAPTTSEWSTILLPTNVHLISEVWGYYMWFLIIQIHTCAISVFKNNWKYKYIFMFSHKNSPPEGLRSLNQHTLIFSMSVRNCSMASLVLCASCDFCCNDSSLACSRCFNSLISVSLRCAKLSFSCSWASLALVNLLLIFSFSDSC